MKEIWRFFLSTQLLMIEEYLENFKVLVSMHFLRDNTEHGNRLINLQF